MTLRLVKPAVHARGLAMAGALAGVLMASAVWAEDAVVRSVAEPASASLDARLWLKRIQDSTYRRSFTGTFVVSSGGSMSSARITHYCDGHSQIERVDALDGQLRSVFRRDDVVHTLWPASRQAVIEQREPFGGFPALAGGGGRQGALAYEAVPERMDRIAGYDAQVLLLKSRDDLRFSQRLWSEKSTGLLLRADMLSAQGEVIESSAFSELVLGARLQPASLVQQMNRLQGYRVSRPVTVRTDLASEGWMLREGVPGFVSLSCIKRPLEPSAARVPEQGGVLLQAIYSDGVTHVSVFIEPGDVKGSRVEGVSTLGATSSLSARQGGWWITVVGDVPAATLRRFASSIERRKP